MTNKIQQPGFQPAQSTSACSERFDEADILQVRLRSQSRLVAAIPYHDVCDSAHAHACRQQAVHTPAGCTWPATPEAHNMPFFIPSSTVPGGTLLSGMRMAAIGGSAFGGQKVTESPSLVLFDFSLLPSEAAPKARALALEAKAAAQQPRMTAIAQLQDKRFHSLELLQAVEYAEHFRYPPGTSVLQWTYGEHQLAPGQASCVPRMLLEMVKVEI
eukprot:1211857-Amphidinium_carterae.1